jgi:hypothetical protein
MRLVSGSYQNYQNGAVSNQLTDIGRGEGVFWGGDRVNLLMCDRKGVLYSVQYSVNASV